MLVARKCDLTNWGNEKEKTLAEVSAFTNTSLTDLFLI